MTTTVAAGRARGNAAHPTLVGRVSANAGGANRQPWVSAPSLFARSSRVPAPHAAHGRSRSGPRRRRHADQTQRYDRQRPLHPPLSVSARRTPGPAFTRPPTCVSANDLFDVPAPQRASRIQSCRGPGSRASRKSASEPSQASAPRSCARITAAVASPASRSRDWVIFQRTVFVGADHQGRRIAAAGLRTESPPERPHHAFAGPTVLEAGEHHSFLPRCGRLLGHGAAPLSHARLGERPRPRHYFPCSSTLRTDGRGAREACAARAKEQSGRGL